MHSVSIDRYIISKSCLVYHQLIGNDIHSTNRIINLLKIKDVLKSNSTICLLTTEIQLDSLRRNENYY